MPKVRSTASKNIETIRENDVMLARATDELRQFFRFRRPGALPDRRIVYHVPARVASKNININTNNPSSTSTSTHKNKSHSSSSSNPTTAVPSNIISATNTDRFCTVDVLNSCAPPGIPEAITLIEKLREIVDDKDENCASNMNRSISSASNINSNSSSNSNTNNTNNDTNESETTAAVLEHAERLPTSPEAITASQTRGTFCFSRRNSARQFELRGNLGSHGYSYFDSNNNINNSANVNSSVLLQGNATNMINNSSTNNNNAAINKILPTCLTLPLRTYTQRVVKEVHDIALLLAVLADCENSNF